MADVIARAGAFFSEPARYLRRNHRIALRAEIVRDLIGPVSRNTIVDLGCGNGAVTSGFLGRGNTITLVDSSAPMAAAAEMAIGRFGAAVKCADALSYAGQPADVVLAIGVLAHVNSTDDVMAAVARNLKPGGRCVIQFSDAGRPLNRIASLLYRIRGRHYRETPRGEVIAAAARRGLVLVREQSHLLILPGMPRLMGRWLLAYDRAVRRWRGLAKHGLDTLALFEKRPTAADGAREWPSRSASTRSISAMRNCSTAISAGAPWMERWRSLDALSVAFATDTLTRIYGVPGKTASAIRRFGMGVG